MPDIMELLRSEIEPALSRSFASDERLWAAIRCEAPRARWYRRLWGFACRVGRRLSPWLYVHVDDVRGDW